MKQKSKYKNKEKARKGSALLLTTILLFVVLSLVVSLSYVTVMEQQMSSKTKSSVGSFFNADSGVEWALNKIANSPGGKISAVFSGQWQEANDYAACPMEGCNVYFLDENGKVITDGAATDVSAIKAVRSVGTQTAGDPTQRAVEAAVGATGGICYTDYSLDPGKTTATPCSVSGFSVKADLGNWGGCYSNGGNFYAAYSRPPGGKCSGNYGGLFNSSTNEGEAYLCCQN
ncbi:MAG: hypothetical protein PHP25_05450 [Candidatus Moranbacteria bacterium]|nr:hypothetical protein [Candidatus Moranbacteria bacterium]